MASPCPAGSGCLAHQKRARRPVRFSSGKMFFWGSLRLLGPSGCLEPKHYVFHHFWFFPGRLFLRGRNLCALLLLFRLRIWCRPCGYFQPNLLIKFLLRDLLGECFCFCFGWTERWEGSTNRSMETVPNRLFTPPLWVDHKKHTMQWSHQVAP